MSKLTNAKIREIFLAHGFTIKEGLTDLKPYVYAAARAIADEVAEKDDSNSPEFEGIAQSSGISGELPGWKLVPVKLTEDMLIAFAEVWYSKKRCIDDCEMADCYEAMLAAAPSTESHVVIPVDAPSALVVAIEQEVERQLDASGICTKYMFRLDGGEIFDSMLDAVTGPAKETSHVPT